MRRALTSTLSAALAGLILLAPHPLRAQEVREDIEKIVKDYLAAHPDEVGEIVKGYLVKHPEAIGEIIAAMLKQHRPAANAGAGGGGDAGANGKAAPDRSAAIASNTEALFSSPHQVTLGNPAGEVTLVEFFDYNCGFCKRALPDMLALLKTDPKLKVVLKEFPILGPGSAEAARVAIAARMQDPGGHRYLTFHQQLFASPGPASRDKALAAAKEAGFDMTQIEHDMMSDEVGTTLAESTRLAGALEITGTPSYVVGSNVVRGAVGIATLQGRIDAARAQRK